MALCPDGLPCDAMDGARSQAVGGTTRRENGTCFPRCFLLPDSSTAIHVYPWINESCHSPGASVSHSLQHHSALQPLPHPPAPRQTGVP